MYKQTTPYCPEAFIRTFALYGLVQLISMQKPHYKLKSFWYVLESEKVEEVLREKEDSRKFMPRRNDFQ